MAARDTAFVARDVRPLEEYLASDVGSILSSKGKALNRPPRLAPATSGCGSCALGSTKDAPTGFWIVALAALASWTGRSFRSRRGVHSPGN
jgi:hypothetical protein